MRLSVLLLAVVVALAARDNDVSATASVDQFNPSKLTTKKLVDSVSTIKNNTNDSRFLRGSKTVTKHNDDANDELDSVDDEERGGKTDIQKFAKWHKNKEPSTSVYERFMLESLVREAFKYGNVNELLKNPNYRKWAGYSAYRKGLGAE